MKLISRCCVDALLLVLLISCEVLTSESKPAITDNGPNKVQYSISVRLLQESDARFYLNLVVRNRAGVVLSKATSGQRIGIDMSSGQVRFPKGGVFLLTPFTISSSLKANNYKWRFIKENENKVLPLITSASSGALVSSATAVYSDDYTYTSSDPSIKVQFNAKGRFRILLDAEGQVAASEVLEVVDAPLYFSHSISSLDLPTTVQAGDTLNLSLVANSAYRSQKSSTEWWRQGTNVLGDELIHSGESFSLKFDGIGKYNIYVLYKSDGLTWRQSFAVNVREA